MTHYKIPIETCSAQRPCGVAECGRCYGRAWQRTYAALVQGQGGLCAICQRPELTKRRGIPKTLSVDDDHVTGLLRGLLCSNCNTGLGLFGDARLLVQAAQYLGRARTRV